MIVLLLGIGGAVLAGRAPGQALPPPVVSPHPVSMIAASSVAGGLSAQILWVDATANAQWLNSVEKVNAVVDHCKAAHINSIVVDVKPLSGEVLYPSRYAPRMVSWKGTPYPPDFDLLDAFIKAGKSAGIPIYVSVNTFSEGHKSFKIGPAYRHKDWQIVSYEVQTFVRGSGDTRFPILRENDTPDLDGLAVFTPASGPDKAAHADEYYAAYDELDHVIAIQDGAATPPSRIPIPRRGGVLVGRGDARNWMIQNLKLGDKIHFEGENRFVPGEESRSDRYAVFVNPILPQVRKYILNVIREVVRRYPVRGIFLDRMRYPNLHADFSDASRQAFEQWLGHPVQEWPEEILTFPPRPGSDPIRGPLFNPWLEWRSHNIHDFLQDARKVILRARRKTQIGVYVGSWYSAYYDVGVNWGGVGFPTRYDWMTPTYPRTGYAPLLDLICSGTYYPAAWQESQAAAAGVAPSATVEGSSEESLSAVRDETVLYGSLYLIQYEKNPEAFRQAIRASLATTGGVMLFDLSYLEAYGWWNILEEELPANRTPPHLLPNFVKSIRSARAKADSVALKEEQAQTVTAPNDHPPL